MAKTQNPQATKRLIKKLSALRQALSNEERDVLDSMVTGEVSAHSIGNAKTKTARFNLARTEVAAHSMTKAKTASASKARNARTEVLAHSISKPKAKSQKVVIKSENVDIDPATGTYFVPENI